MVYQISSGEFPFDGYKTIFRRDDCHCRVRKLADLSIRGDRMFKLPVCNGFPTSVMTESAFKARDIGLRAQKKILSRMAGKNIAKVFIDDITASLLDNLYRLAKQYSNNKKEAEKLIKNIIKIVIKLGVLHKNNLLSEDDLKQAEKFKNKFRMAGMTIISFYEVDFSYDRNYLVQVLDDSQKILQSIISKHLTDKSLSRVESVFSFFGNETFLDAIFKRDSEYREALGRVVADLNKAIENGDL